jgi:GT2 family glycosyltransferase
MRPAGTGARALGNGQAGGRPAAYAAVRPGRALATAARPGVSVVVCAYTQDRWQKLSRAIGSLHDQDQAVRQIILVIDHCPGLLERCRREFPGVTVVPNRFRRGLSGSRNTGLAEARGEVVAFLDDDAVASRDWIAVLGGHYADPQVLGVGGLVEPGWEEGRPRWFPPELDWVVGCSYRGMPARAAPVRNFIGANMSFRRELLIELRGFAPALGRVGAIPLGCEETELCLRASQLHPDGVLRYDPAAAVRHAVPPRRGRWGYLLSRCCAEGLSKARVAALAGPRRALATERSYLRSTLPRRVGRSLADAARGDLAGLGSVLAILAAVAVTGAGYLAGRALGLARGRAARTPGSAPARPRPARTRARPAGPGRLAACLVLWAAGLPAAAVSRASRSLAAGASDRLSELRAVVVIMAAVTLTGAAYVSQGTTGLVRDRAIPALGSALGRPPSRIRAGLSALAPWAGLVLSLALWGAGLTGVAVSRVAGAGLGLISVLPVTFWAGLGVLALSFSWSVMRRSGQWPVLAAHVLALIAMLNATPAILYGTLRYSWAWKHVGVIDFISHHGVDFSLGGVLGVYQGWPGFFALNSFLTSASGLSSALAYASWAVAVNHLLWLGPFILIARTFTSDQRLIWTGACLFEIGNWVGQDYFSPQAFTYFLYLTVIAVCLRWLWPPGAPKRWLMVACLVPLLVAIASSHQLTPLMLVGALAILAVCRQLRPRTLPVVMTVITVGWIAYAGRSWLLANRSQLLAGLGNPWANTSAHLVGVAPVPFDQILVDWGARAASAAMGILAVAGFWRYWRRHDKPARRSWLRVALLALAAVPVVAANSYGGEIIFRSYLFALPFLAIAAAAAFFPDPAAGRSAVTGAALLVTLLAQLIGFSLGNYGDEAMNYFTPREVAASQWLYRTAPAGSQLVGATANFPWAFVHYSRYSYTFLDNPPSLDRAALRTPVPVITKIMRPGSSPASYLILTRSQAEQLYLTGAWPPGALPRVTGDLLASGKYRVVYRNADAIILQLSGRGG